MHWPASYTLKAPQPRTPVTWLLGLLCLLAAVLQMLAAWKHSSNGSLLNPGLPSPPGLLAGPGLPPAGLTSNSGPTQAPSEAAWANAPQDGAWANAPCGALANAPWEGACLLSPQKLLEGQWWRLLFFSLAHAGFWHWAAACLGFCVVSRSVEPIIGGWHLLLVSGLGSLLGGAVHCLASHWGALPPNQPLLGMLPALFALLGVYGTVLPGWRLGAASRWRGARWCASHPWAPRARHAAWAAAGLAGLWWVTGWHPEAGPAALLPALCTGWVYTRMLGFGDRFFFQRMMGEGDPLEQRMEQMNWEEFLNAELNPVLEKIARHGLRSLNAAERRILRHSRRKLEGW